MKTQDSSKSKKTPVENTPASAVDVVITGGTAVFTGFSSKNI